MIDIGVNLTHPSLLKELESNQFQWQENGVENIIAIASDLEESIQITQLSNQYKGIYHTLGCHPHHADSWQADSATKIKTLFQQSNKVVAIGETGLDFNRNYSTQANQIKAFHDQIALSKTLSSPLYLHERDAEDSLLGILNEHFDKNVPGVLHCFTASKETLKRYLDIGLYIGITGWICDERRGQELQEAIKYIPKDRILMETDAPYLLPRDIRPRPKKNHPKFLPHIIKQAAFFAEIEESELIQLSIENTQRLFAIKGIGAH